MILRQNKTFASSQSASGVVWGKVLWSFSHMCDSRSRCKRFRGTGMRYIYIDLKCCWIMLQREELLAIRQSSIRLEDVDCPKITCLGLARTYPLHKAAKLDRRQGKVDVLCQEFHFPKRVCLQIVGLGWVLKHITVKDIKRYRYWR